MAATVLGINFGASTSSVSLINKEGHADCIADEDGTRQILNAIAYGVEEEYIGNGAKSQLVRNSANTVLGFRDLLGKSYADVSSYTSPYNSAELIDKDGQPAFSVTINGEPASLTADEVAVKFLAYLVGHGSDFVGRKIDQAVIALPDVFLPKQREAVRSAAERAGVKVAQIIDDSAAAFSAFEDVPSTTLSYAHRNIAVVDVGASTTTATILAVRNGLATKLASETDSKVGGDAFDQVLMDWASKEFTKKTKQPLDAGDHRAQAKLRLAVGITKQALSASTSANCSVDSLSNGYDFSSTINRTRFDMLAGKVYGQIESVVSRALKSAELDVLQIDEVRARRVCLLTLQIFLVGGSAKLPGVASRLTDYLFASKQDIVISAGLDPEEAIAKGCALQGIRLLDNGNVNDLLRDDVRRTPALTKPLGLKTGDGLTVLLDAPAPLPTRRMVELVVGPSVNGKSHALLSLYEGEATVKISQPERKTNGHAQKAEDEDEDDEDDDDDEEEIRALVVQPSRHIVNLAVPVANSSQKSTVKLTITVDAAGHGTIEAKSAKASFSV